MLELLVTLLILLIVMGLAWWVLTMIPLPEPIKNIATVIFVVICAVVLIYFLLGLVGSAPRLSWR